MSRIRLSDGTTLSVMRTADHDKIYLMFEYHCGSFTAEITHDEANKIIAELQVAIS